MERLMARVAPTLTTEEEGEGEEAVPPVVIQVCVYVTTTFAKGCRTLQAAQRVRTEMRSIDRHRGLFLS